MDLDGQLITSPSSEAADITAGGLTDGEVQLRRERGQTNEVAAPPSRTLAQILRANVLTRFNAILGTLLVVILIVGPIQDALFGFVLIANTGIGIIGEVRAKRTLDRLALLSAPVAHVIRNGEATEIPLGEIVLDDVLALGPGDQLAVDGVILSGELELDESLLTGEAEPMAKRQGDEVLSGSFVVAGSGRYQATRVGRSAYAQTIAQEARRFSLVHSELQAGINLILRLVTWAMVPAAALLVTSQLRRSDLADAVRGTVAGVGSMVPEGLVLLTSLAFGAAVVRLATRDVLVQELAAVEGLARVDTICLDKTGTLTAGQISVQRLEHLDDHGSVEAALGALAVADPSPNASLSAIGAAFPAPSPPWRVASRVEFSSARKWGATTFEGRGTWYLGAPEVLLDAAVAPAAAKTADSYASEGKRVILLARSVSAISGAARPELPTDLVPAALIVLEEALRPDASKTLRYFLAQDVTVKVISGDNPLTAAAVARRVGVPGVAQGLDSRDLPTEPDRLADAMEREAVFGRVTPHQKKAMVAALQEKGHVVAMTGDGVNDVLALKDADIGVAMGAGSAAARAVAKLILLNNNFDCLPGVVAEGRRVLANIERVANLFVTKTVYAAVLAVAIGAARLPYPFLPRQLTIISTLTIGVPAFFLALAPNTRRYTPGFVRRTLEFTVPTGLVVAAVIFCSYEWALHQSGVTLDQARSTTTVSLFVVAMWVLVVLSMPLRPWKLALLAAMAGAFVGAVTIPAIADTFALSLPDFSVVLPALAIALGGVVTLETGRRVIARRTRRRRPSPSGSPTAS